MRALLAAAIVAVSCTSGPPAPPSASPTAAPGVLTIVAILDLSGPRAALGAQQKNALQLWQDQAAPRGVTAKLRTVDAAGSDARVLIELRRAATDPAVDAVVVGTPVTYDDAFGRALDVAALPVVLTLPIASDPAARPGGSWAFALAPTLETIAAREVEDAARRGWLPSLVLTEPRDRADALARALTLELDRQRVEPLAALAFGIDGSAPPTVRASLADARSVHCTVAAPLCASVADLARQAGAPAMFYLPYLTTPGDLADRKELASRAMVPGAAALFAPARLGVTTSATAVDRFVRSYTDRFGALSTPAATAFDAATLLAAAAERAGADDRGALRDALASTRTQLVAGSYAFAEGRRAGADPGDLGYLRWDGSAFTTALGPPVRLR